MAEGGMRLIELRFDIVGGEPGVVIDCGVSGGVVADPVHLLKLRGALGASDREALAYLAGYAAGYRREALAGGICWLDGYGGVDGVG